MVGPGPFGPVPADGRPTHLAAPRTQVGPGTLRADRRLPLSALPVAGDDAVDVGTLADSWRSEPGTPIYVQPYLPQRPTGLGDEEAYRWFLEVPGVPVPVGRVKELIDAAVRLDPADARATLAKD